MDVPSDPAGEYFMKGIEAEVARDAERQYRIAKRSGSSIDRCVAASFVAAAYLQAEDEDAYERWKRTEERDCGQALNSP